MKTLKVILPMLALGLMASAPFAHAQEKKGRGGMAPEARVEQLNEALTLTADQKTKILAILEKSRADMQNVPKEEQKTKRADMMKAQNDQIRALLTPEQKTKFDAMPQGGGGGGGKKKNQ